MKSINPHLLDVVKRDTDYALYYAGHPLTTPSGNEVAHNDPRLLEHMLRELSVARVLDPDGVGSYSLFATRNDFLGRADDRISASLDELVKADPIVRRKSGPAKARILENSEFLLDYLDKRHYLAFYFSGITGSLRSLNEFLVENAQGGLDLIERSFDKFLAVIKETYARLTPEKKAAVISLCAAHEAGIILPLLLILRRITASEYANGLFSIHLPYADQKDHGRTFNEILKPEVQKKHVTPDWQAPEASFLKLREQASMALEYLSYYDCKESKAPGVRELINMGENFGLEFKSCLRWNLKAARKDPAIEHANLKTIAAFLNSSGGKLLVGVRDDGSIEGIETDGFPHADKFALHFWNLVKSWLGQDICPFIRTAFEIVDGKTVFLVECAGSPRPVFLNQKQGEDEFYIRVGPSSAKLTIREALKYISQRFEEQKGSP